MMDTRLICWLILLRGTIACDSRKEVDSMLLLILRRQVKIASMVLAPELFLREAPESFVLLKL